MNPRGSDPALKALIFGPSGSGKTALACTCPNPLVLLSERQGEATIRKRAKELGVKVPTVVIMETMADYRDAVRALHGDPTKPFKWVNGDDQVVLEMDPWPETVVIDSITDACELVRKSVLKASPPKKGEDGLEVFGQRHWGALRNRCEKMIRWFRDVPTHVVFLALLDERLNESSDGMTTRTIGPMLPMRSLPDVLMAATNVSGMLTRRSVKIEGQDDKELVYSIRTNGPSYLKVKPFRPINDIEEANFSLWLEKLKAEQPEPKTKTKKKKAAPAAEAN